MPYHVCRQESLCRSRNRRRLATLPTKDPLRHVSVPAACKSSSSSSSSASGQLSLTTQPGTAMVYFLHESVDNETQNPFELLHYQVTDIVLRVNGRDTSHTVDRSKPYFINTYWNMVRLLLLLLLCYKMQFLGGCYGPKHWAICHWPHNAGHRIFHRVFHTDEGRRSI